MTASTQIKYTTRDQWLNFLEQVVEPTTEKCQRRQYRRYALNSYVTVYGEADGEAFRTTWALHQVSRGGMMAVARREFPVWIDVSIELAWDDRTMLLRGKIRHCTQTVGGYKIGVQLIFPG